MDFKELGIIEPILRALSEEGYTEPTPIQVDAIPVLMEGKDLLGSAQTGTGKTAAFAVPILQKLVKDTSVRPSFRVIRALILAPTRELASQIRDSFKTYGQNLQLKTAVIFGGVNQSSQVNTLRAGVDILVATPGRLLDLMQQGHIDLKYVHTFVLDEADRMLDMGFVKDVEKIVSKLPSQRQTMMFSATMPAEIAKLAANILTAPVRIAVTPVEATIDTITQGLYYVGKKQKNDLILYLLQNPTIVQALIFTRTKHGANKLATYLGEFGVEVDAIHGNKSQSARERALTNFKSRRLRVLVATDIAARGIDIAELSHVINYDLPEDPETYIHRMGRTGRAGFSGTALSLCEPGEVGRLKDIQRHIHASIPVIKDHPYAATFANASLEIKSSFQRVEPSERVKISDDKEEKRPFRQSSHDRGSSSSHRNAPRESHFEGKSEHQVAKPHREKDAPREAIDPSGTSRSHRNAPRENHFEAKGEFQQPKPHREKDAPREVIDPELRRAKLEYVEQQKQRAEKEAARKEWKTKGRYEQNRAKPSRPNEEFATTQERSSFSKKPSYRRDSSQTSRTPSRFGTYAKRSENPSQRSERRPFKAKNETVSSNLKTPKKPSEKKSYESYSKGDFKGQGKR